LILGLEELGILAAEDMEAKLDFNSGAIRNRLLKSCNSTFGRSLTWHLLGILQNKCFCAIFWKFSGLSKIKFS